jgi:hypothetical protein
VVPDGQPDGGGHLLNGHSDLGSLTKIEKRNLTKSNYEGCALNTKNRDNPITNYKIVVIINAVL